MIKELVWILLDYYRDIKIILAITSTVYLNQLVA